MERRGRRAVNRAAGRAALRLVKANAMSFATTGAGGAILIATKEMTMSDRKEPLGVRGEAPAQERRRAARARCLIAGRVLFPDQARTRDVTVRNRSERGAMIEGVDLTDLPDHFTLSLPARGESFPVAMRWSHYHSAGVELGVAEA
jgi:hypothetical protein